MSIIINNNIEEQLNDAYIKLFEKVVECALDYENCPFETEVSITITDNDEIRTLNKNFRNKDKPTDVLSFPLLEFDKPSQFDAIDENDDELFDLDNGELILGDIVISYDKSKEQADLYGHSLERELGFLIAHSMLHLMGYDHIISKEEQIMNEKQEQILSEVGLKR